MSVLKVSELMTKDPETVFVDEEIDLAHLVMSLGRIRHLPVLNRAGQLVGLVTHRDVLHAMESSLLPKAHQSDPLMLPVEKVMTAHPKTVSPDTPALEAAQLMRERLFGALPVVEKNHLIGIITEADFVALAARQLADLSS